MKAHNVNGFAAAACRVSAFLFLVFAMAALAGAPSWRWRVDAWPASSTNAVTLLASTGGEIAWVRWNGVAGSENTAEAEMTLESSADGWQTSLAKLSVSNEVSTNLVNAAASMVMVSNAQWRAGDRLLPKSEKITGGTVAIGYWYYE